MMSSWLIPEHFADILPREARVLEVLRRKCLDLFRVHGFELVEPPLVEYVESLLTGSGSDLDNNTFKFMDPGTGRTVGIRADMTPQCARIDAHILGRKGVSRLCYAGSCLHARPMHPMASREPVVAGVELFGASGIEADAEIITLAVRTLRKLGVESVHIDIGHTGILRALLGERITDERVHAVVRALRMKDPVALTEATAGFEQSVQDALQLLLRSFGDISVIDALQRELPQKPEIQAALREVRELAGLCQADEVSVDFCDVHGYQYLTGITFSVNIPNYAQAILRGGRYDGVGLAFGRSRPACGFTVYLRALAGLRTAQSHRPEAVVARGPLSADLEEQVEKLREEGRIVVRMLPDERDEDVLEQFVITQELIRTSTGFELKAL